MITEKHIHCGPGDLLTGREKLALEDINYCDLRITFEDATRAALITYEDTRGKRVIKNRYGATT